MTNNKIITEAQKLPQKAIKENNARIPDLKDRSAHVATVAATCAKKEAG